MTSAGFVFLTLAVLYLIKLNTGPFLYHILKIIFWIVVCYHFNAWQWSLLAIWDMAWLLIWLERDPNRIG